MSQFSLKCLFILIIHILIDDSRLQVFNFKNGKMSKERGKRFNIFRSTRTNKKENVQNLLLGDVEGEERKKLFVNVMMTGTYVFIIHHSFFL